MTERNPERPHDEAFARLRGMLRIRRFSERLLDEAGLVVGPVMPVSGYETVPTAVAAAMQPDDRILLSHRNHHYLIAAGADLTELYGEIFCRDVAPAQGRAGSMHLTAPDHGVLWSSSVIAGNVALAAGVALACRRRGAGVTFCVFGDGAMGEGIVAETFNLVALQQLPLVFICENNTQRADDEDYTTAPREVLEHAAKRLTDVAAAFGIATADVDGSRPAETAAVMAEIVGRVRAGGGPCFVEAAITPWPAGMDSLIPTKPAGDTVLDDALATDVGDRWAAADPVLQAVRDTVAEGVGIDAVHRLDEDIRAEVDRAISAAKAAATPNVEVAVQDVWGRQ